MNSYNDGKSIHEHRDAKQIWRWCPDCRCNYRLSDEKRHFAKHDKGRPDAENDAMLSLSEVKELTGKTQGQLNHLVRTGQVKVIRVPQGERHRTWISQKSIVDYAKREMERGDMRLMERLANPPVKRRQNYMEMPSGGVKG